MKQIAERIEEIREGNTWTAGWNRKECKLTYLHLIEKLDKYGIPQNEVDDILSVALLAGIKEGRNR